MYKTQGSYNLRESALRPRSKSGGKLHSNKYPETFLTNKNNK